MKLTRKFCLAVLFVMVWVLVSTCLTTLYVVPFAYAQETQTVLKPNQLFTYSLAPEQERLFVLQMKKGDFAGIESLAREGLNLSFEIYDSTREHLFEKSEEDDRPIWFVAQTDGDFLLVSKLAKDQYPEVSGAQRISIQYNNKFKLPIGTKQKDIRKISGYDIKIMSAGGTQPENKASIVLIEKNGQLKKILKSSGSEPKGFSFPYPDYASKADSPEEKRIIRLVKSTVDKTGDGIPDVMIRYFSGGAHCCFETYFINLGETVETVETMSEGNVEFIHIDKNPKGGLLFRTFDNGYTYWLTSFATSPFVEVILEFTNGKLRPNFDLMKKPAPSLAVLKKKAQNYRQKLSLKPYRGEENEEDAFSDAVFWGVMLDLIYTGNEELAWQFLDLVWPPQKQGKALFIRDFKKQLLKSQYWRMILEDKRK